MTPWLVRLHIVHLWCTNRRAKKASRGMAYACASRHGYSCAQGGAGCVGSSNLRCGAFLHFMKSMHALGGSKEPEPSASSLPRDAVCGLENEAMWFNTQKGECAHTHKTCQKKTIFAGLFALCVKKMQCSSGGVRYDTRHPDHKGIANVPGGHASISWSVEISHTHRKILLRGHGGEVHRHITLLPLPASYTLKELLFVALSLASLITLGTCPPTDPALDCFGLLRWCSGLMRDPVGDDMSKLDGSDKDVRCNTTRPVGEPLSQGGDAPPCLGDDQFDMKNSSFSLIFRTCQ
jgi:hypothetical protein